MLGVSGGPSRPDDEVGDTGGLPRDFGGGVGKV